jgi:hypothetical protein
MEKYNQGKIYKIINTVDDKLYIGSSIQKLHNRMNNHRTNASNSKKQSILYEHMRRLGVEHFKIILIKLYPCASNEELEAEEFNEISKYDKSILLNDNLVFKKRSENHVQKVADSNRGDKSINWNFGSVFKRTGKDRDGYCIDSWCFSYREYKDGKNKIRSVQFSVKKYGDDEAKRLATETRYRIYPEAKNSQQDTGEKNI